LIDGSLRGVIARRLKGEVELNRGARIFLVSLDRLTSQQILADDSGAFWLFDTVAGIHFEAF
jgi:hypothetical protein